MLPNAGVCQFWQFAPLPLNALADPGANIIGETFYSEGALRFGDYIARFAAAPFSDSARALTGRPAYNDDNELLHSVVEFFSRNPVEYELRAQLCVDLQRTPIEDSSIDWPEDISPFQPLAKIVLPSQQAYSPARRA